MEEKILDVKYVCQHDSCQVKCLKGVLNIDESLFNRLSSSYEDRKFFKSPKGYCRLSFPQVFKVLDIKDAGDDDLQEQNDEIDRSKTDPIEMLKSEHKVVISILENFEKQMRKRDIEELWVTTGELLNAFTLHSLEKEEKGLFPLLISVIPTSSALIGIMTEDHIEELSLLKTFRSALTDNFIYDGLGQSVIVNLRNHIHKEEDDFFEEIDQYLDSETKDRLLEIMKEIEKSHVKIKIADRTASRSSEESKEREKHVLAIQDNMDDGDGH